MKKWYAVIGDPIAQSRSPEMHSNWLQEMQLDATYIPIQVTQELELAVASLKRLGCSGWNVTVPHKTAILPLLDEIDPIARKMEAVNTVVVREDKSLFGTNTDGIGFVQSLEESYGLACRNQPVLIVGAGGAARGIAFALEAAGYGPITITNRTVHKAAQLAAQLQEACSLSLIEAASTLDQYGLIIQTTSVGMAYAQSGVPIQLDRLLPDTIVCDIVYNPLQTEFLKQAAQRGAKILNGLGMFVHQGALAFQLWTGQYPNTKKTIRLLEKELEEQHVNK